MPADKLRVLELDFTLIQDEEGLQIYQCALPSLDRRILLIWDTERGLTQKLGEAADIILGGWIASLALTDSIPGPLRSDWEQDPEKALRGLEQSIKDQVVHHRTETLRYEKLLAQLVTVKA
jgi:hypothetical protein